MSARECLPGGVNLGGVCPGGGQFCPGGCLPRWDCLRMAGGGCLPEHVYISLWTEFLTHVCEIITFPQLRLRMVTMLCLSLPWLHCHQQQPANEVTERYCIQSDVPVRLSVKHVKVKAHGGGFPCGHFLWYTGPHRTLTLWLWSLLLMYRTPGPNQCPNLC